MIDALAANVEEFWPQYLQMHSQYGTKAIHAFGIVVLVLQSLIGILFAHPIFGFFVGIVCAYACAFTGHLWVEHNLPASFKHPLLSLICDLKMTYLFFKGEFREAGR